MKKLIITMVALLLSGPASAITVANLDAPSGTGVPDIGALDAGLNTISGSISGQCNSAFGSTFAECVGALRFDRFRFNVPTGHELSAISVSTSGIGPSYNFLRTTLSTITFVPGGFLPDEMAIRSGAVNTSFDGMINLGNPVGPFDAGTFSFFVGVNSFLFSVPANAVDEDFNADWSVAITVSPVPSVPLPASGILLLASGLALARLRHRTI